MNIGVGDRAAQLPRRRHRGSVEAEDDVALTYARLRRRAAFSDGGDQRAFRLLQAEAVGNLRGDRLDGDAKPAALHGALLLQLRHDLLRDVRRNGEADADAAAVRSEDRGIHTDHLAAAVEQRAAGVAAVERRVDLDEVVIGARTEIAAARRNDAGSHRAREAEGITDRDHPVADAHFVGIAPAHRRQRSVGRDLQYRKVGLVVLAEQARWEMAAILQCNLDLL